jgi:hypothetical protein
MENCQNLFETICNFKNLYQAYLQARKCKRYRQDILDFGYRLEENLLKLEEELSNQNYQHGGYRQFVVCDSKKRQIEVAPFRDRVVHHALCNIIDPIFDQGFIFDSYACRQDKGTHRAVKRLQQFLRKLLKSKLISERERERVNWLRKFVPLDINLKLKLVSVIIQLITLLTIFLNYLKKFLFSNVISANIFRMLTITFFLI